MAQLTVVVVTPERTELEVQADFVALTLFDGEIGIAPGHTPLIGRLRYGEMRLTQGSTVRRFYVDGGFVQVANDVVSVLTSRAVPAENLSRDAAKSQLEAARLRPANSPELLEIRERLVSQARAQVAVARRAREG